MKLLFLKSWLGKVRWGEGKRKLDDIVIGRNMHDQPTVRFVQEHWHISFVSGCTIDIIDMVDQSNIELRPGLDTVLNYCRDTQVPFLVFSAGIGDLIERVLLVRSDKLL
jgi:5'-nucleotidase